MKKKAKQKAKNNISKKITQNNKNLTLDYNEAVRIYNIISPFISKLIKKEIDFVFKRIFNPKILINNNNNNECTTPDMIRINMDHGFNSNLSDKEKNAIHYISQNNIDDDLSLPNNLLKDINLNEITQIFDENREKNIELLREYLNNSKKPKNKTIDVKSVSIEDFVNNLKKENLKKE